MVNISFLQARNADELSDKIPMAYRQLKAYLLKYSHFSNEIVMNIVARPSEIPSDTDIVAISGVTHQYTEIIDIGKTVRVALPDVLLVLGGHHISLLPESLPEFYDLAVLSEGEETFREVVDAYVESGKNKTCLGCLKGIALHNGGKGIVVKPRGDVIAPLDLIPFPVLEGDDPPYLFTSRGCPFDCSFCSSTVFWGKVRFFSSKYVVNQIEYILGSFPEQETIVFWDDLVVAHRQRFREIVEALEGKGITKRVSFGMAVRANLVDEELCKLLVRLNTSFVSFGAESGNERVLKILKGRNSLVLDNQKALDLLSHHGLVSSCSFVVGAPSETRTELKDTFDFIHANLQTGKLHRYVINILMPLPGTAMWEYARSHGIVSDPIEWERFCYYASYRDSKLSGIQEWIERRLAVRSYYLNEAQVPHKELLQRLADFELAMERVEASRDREALGVYIRKCEELNRKINEYDDALRIHKAECKALKNKLAEYEEVTTKPEVFGNSVSHDSCDRQASLENHKAVFKLAVERYLTSCQGQFNYVNLLIEHLDYSRFYPWVEQVDSYHRVAGSTVLSAGCASAGDLYAFMERGARKACGVEVDKGLADLARFRFEISPYNNQFEISVYEGGNLPYPDEFFDIVFSVQSLENVGNLAGYLGKLFRVLGRGGVVFLDTPNRYYCQEEHCLIPYPHYLHRGLRGHLVDFLCSLRFPKLLDAETRSRFPNLKDSNIAIGSLIAKIIRQNGPRFGVKILDAFYHSYGHEKLAHDALFVDGSLFGRARKFTTFRLVVGRE